MRILSGVQSSGKLHLGNYFGAIRQFVSFQDHEEGGARSESLYFIANLHALTTVRDPDAMRTLARDAALDFLALGLDPKKATLFRQSDIPEVTELFWYLSVVAPVSRLENAVSFKDKTARGIAPDLGLFTYPVLMAADILLYGADVVPVGRDQLQHLEITRELATKFNLAFVKGYDPADPTGAEKGTAPGILKLPRPFVQEETAVVPGIDGQKMSKSYGNAIDLFGDDASLKKRIMGIKSDSTPVEAPKDPASTPIYPLLKLLASPADMAEIDRTFAEGGKGYGHYKVQLLELFHAKFDDARKKRKELEADPAYVDAVLAEGRDRARAYAAPIMDAVRRAVGTL